MQLITNQTFGGERSLYKLSDAKLDHVTILAGDSPIKHGTNLTLTNCDIEGKYPLWINTNTVVDNCLLKVTARSGLWYLKNFKVTNTRFECPKSFRDSDGIEIRDCTFTDARKRFGPVETFSLKRALSIRATTSSHTLLTSV